MVGIPVAGHIDPAEIAPPLEAQLSGTRQSLIQLEQVDLRLGNMKAYSKPQLKKLGTMSAVTRKSGPAFDVEVMQNAAPDGYNPCEFYPFYWCP